MLLGFNYVECNVHLLRKEIFQNQIKIFQKNVAISKSSYICHRLFGEKSEQLKAICACIPICKIWKILEMDIRYELASLFCIL